MRRRFLGQMGGAAWALWAGTPARTAEPQPRIKVAQIGVSHGHASKLGIYRQSADYEVVGLCEPDETLRQSVADQPWCRGLPWLSRKELLALPGLQAVLIESEMRDSLEHAEACVQAGMHVHVDKPAGESLPQLKQLLDLATKRQRLVQTGYMFRYNPAVLLLKMFLNQGWLGEVFEVHGVMSKVVTPAGRKAHARYSGGMMFELGCHVIDLVVGILGQPERVTAFPRHSSPHPDGLVDNMLAVFEYPRATASVRATGLEVEGFSRRHLSVVGTSGTFHIQPLDAPTATISLDQPREKYKAGTQVIQFPKYERYIGDAADMARIIRGECPATYGPAHDLAVQETILRASGLSVW